MNPRVQKDEAKWSTLRSSKIGPRTALKRIYFRRDLFSANLFSARSIFSEDSGTKRCDLFSTRSTFHEIYFRRDLFSTRTPWSCDPIYFQRDLFSARSPKHICFTRVALRRAPSPATPSPAIVTNPSLWSWLGGIYFKRDLF